MKAWILREHGSPTLDPALDEAELPADGVLVDVAYSTLNYKDALAMTGKGKIIRSFPMIPGIDLAGTVAETVDGGPAVGTRVLANGHGLGEVRAGGYAERARVPGDWLLPIPERFSTEDAMSIGTAGYTAALCVLAVEEGGAQPGQREVLVTGATGGVGSLAVHLLASRGHRVWAVTGRPEHADHLRRLGATEIVERSELSGDVRPLGKQRWFSAIDVAGGKTLANVLSMTTYGGVVAATGLADGIELPGFVTPFILRNVRLQGVDSVSTPRARREAAWALLEENLDLGVLSENREVVEMDALADKAEALLSGRVRGRVVVKIA